MSQKRDFYPEFGNFISLIGNLGNELRANS